MLDGLPLETKIAIGLLAPLSLTLICWLVSPLLTGWRNWARNRSWSGFWLMLLASYLIFAVVLAGGRFLTGNDKVDPSSQLVQLSPDGFPGLMSFRAQKSAPDFAGQGLYAITTNYTRVAGVLGAAGELRTRLVTACFTVPIASQPGYFPTNSHLAAPRCEVMNYEGPASRLRIRVSNGSQAGGCVQGGSPFSRSYNWSRSRNSAFSRRSLISSSSRE